MTRLKERELLKSVHKSERWTARVDFMSAKEVKEILFRLRQQGKV